MLKHFLCFDVVSWLRVGSPGCAAQGELIGVSASCRISEERRVDPAVKSACVLLTFVVIVNRSTYRRQREYFRVYTCSCHANWDWEFPITKFGTWKGESEFS